jgi:hypothetical protein
MLRFPNELLGRSRTLPQALTDLVTKHNNMGRNNPERAGLAVMIRRLGTEIAAREGRSLFRHPLCEACAEQPFLR